KKYVWVGLAIEALAVTLAVIYTHRQPPIFQATASVQIEPRLPDLLGDRPDSFQRANIGGIDYYAQQKEVLDSYTLVKQTVTDHRLYTKLLPETSRSMMKLDDQIEDATLIARSMMTIKYPDDNRIMYVV